jgi:hypothetical protein
MGDLTELSNALFYIRRNVSFFCSRFYPPERPPGKLAFSPFRRLVDFVFVLLLSSLKIEINK